MPLSSNLCDPASRTSSLSHHQLPSMVYTSSSKQSTPGKSRPSLYQTIGEKALHDACKTFVARLRKDERTSKAFATLNETEQATMLFGFLAHITGGPAHTGPSMYEYHRHLTLTDAHFNAYLEIFEETLMDCDLEKQAVQKLLSAVREQRNEVLGKDKKGGCCVSAMWGKCCSWACPEDKNAMYLHAAGATVAVTAVAIAGYFAVKALRKND